MAVQHSFEVANGSYDDDGHQRRTGKDFFLGPSTSSFKFTFNSDLNLVPFVGYTIRNLVELRSSYHYCYYWLWSFVSGLAYFTVRMDNRASYLALFCNRHLCFCIPHFRLLQVS